MANDRLFVLCRFCGEVCMVGKYYPTPGLYPTKPGEDISEFIDQHANCHPRGRGHDLECEPGFEFLTEQQHYDLVVSSRAKPWPLESNPPPRVTGEKDGDFVAKVLLAVLSERAGGEIRISKHDGMMMLTAARELEFFQDDDGGIGVRLIDLDRPAKSCNTNPVPQDTAKPQRTS